MMVGKMTTADEINELVTRAHQAYLTFKNINISNRAKFMHLVADEIEKLGAELIYTAHAETNLPHNRLVNEKARTMNQWRNYADALSKVLINSIDTADPTRNPFKPDIRKTYIGVGVVAVFGASNFPFAFSTLGGDTASAIAAGCAVIVKTHSGHPNTSTLMASAIRKAIKQANLPEGLFAEVVSQGSVGGQQLVKHPLIKAVGFTGSYNAGKTLFDLANQRPEPIPVFAEMGSVNPVFLLPRKLETHAEDIAKRYFESLTLGVGQFCTNPGILVVPDTRFLPKFLDTLRSLANNMPSLPMLNERIAASYHKEKATMLAAEGISVLASGIEISPTTHGNAVLATVTSSTFLANPDFEHEVFGPFGLIVKYKDYDEALAIARRIKGQLTATILAEPQDLDDSKELVSALSSICGRLLLNDFPTGVEVSYAMHHGGPFPASTDNRYTSVGPDAIKRFVRPLSYQNWPNHLLPDELGNENMLKIWRIVNGELTNNPITV